MTKEAAQLYIYSLDDLRTRYRWAQHAAELEGFNVDMHTVSDSRMAMLSLPVANGSAADSFLLTQDLLEKLAGQASDGTLTADDVRRTVLDANEDAVRNSFAADALNDINTSYYLSEAAFHPGAGLATLYNDNRPLNLALGRLLASVPGNNTMARATKPLRVKELCAGDNTAHWRVITQGAVAAGVPQLDITLSDFFAPRIHKKARVRQNTLRTDVCSLFDQPIALPMANRFDAVVTTYGFDSVWLPGDIHLCRIGGAWFQTQYRVKVADWHPRRTELLQALRQGRALTQAVPKDYDGIAVESLLVPFDMQTYAYKNILSDYSGASFNVPAGLAQYVAASFNSQLHANGVFVSFDMGDFGFLAQDYTLPSQAKSGVAARYQPGNFVLAKEILEKLYGLHVELLNLQQFADTYLPPDWHKTATNVEIHQIQNSPTNGVMIVRQVRRR